MYISSFRQNFNAKKCFIVNSVEMLEEPLTQNSLSDKQDFVSH